MIVVPRSGGAGGEVVWSAGSSSVAIWCAQTHAHLRSVMDTGEADNGETEDGAGGNAGRNMGGVASAGALPLQGFYQRTLSQESQPPLLSRRVVAPMICRNPRRGRARPESGEERLR